MSRDSDQGGSSKVVDLIISAFITAVFAGVIVVAILVFRSQKGANATFKTVSSKIEPAPAKTDIPKQPAQSEIQIGSKAPDIAGEDIEGKNFKLTDYRGKVVMLDFWGHW
jgi:cytochrome oxidase Cu insertion factor (SCO1/SenC/PrrC family)